MSDLVELKPCPFCGGDKLSHGWSAPGYDGPTLTGNVQCHNCNALIYSSGGEVEAIAAWNTRPRITALETELAEAKAREERLREALETLVHELAKEDDEGLLEHAEPIIKARKALAETGGGDV